ncbi:MAG: hypothetical protein ACJ77K_01010 [Bacteroidia bacterium]
MRKLVFLSLVLFASKALASDSLQTGRHYHRIYFFTAGLQAYSPETIDCNDRQASLMSFGYKRKGGCVIGPLKWLRIESHNKRMERKMVKRFGADWYTQYNELRKNC